MFFLGFGFIFTSLFVYERVLNAFSHFTSLILMGSVLMCVGFLLIGSETFLGEIDIVFISIGLTVLGIGYSFVHLSANVYLQTTPAKMFPDQADDAIRITSGLYS